MTFMAYGERLFSHRDHAFHPLGFFFSTVVFKVSQFVDVVISMFPLAPHNSHVSFNKRSIS